MRPRAFTLIELLVVIAVIAILAGLLLPGLTRSQQSAQRLKCVSSLRQLGLAAQMYCDDSGGKFFPYNGAITNAGRIYWFGWLQADSTAEGQREFDLTQGIFYPYLQSRGVEVCPSLNYSLAQFKLKATGAAYGYGVNKYLAAAFNQPPVAVAKIRQPTQTALFADAAQVNDFQAPATAAEPMLEEFYYVDTSADYPNGHFRHAQKANVVFADGHVAWEKMAAGSLDLRLPEQSVGQLRPEILIVP